MNRLETKHRYELPIHGKSYNYRHLDIVMTAVELRLQRDEIDSDTGMYHLSLDPNPDTDSPCEYVLTCWWTEGKE